MRGSSGLEREIKLRYATGDAARAAVEALGPTRVRPRRLQDDRLFDTAAGTLRETGCTLRLRIESLPDGERATVTFKGPVHTGLLKVREEIETTVGERDAFHQILERTGWRVWFRYQKYREEYSEGGVVVAIDETPVGTFVELEGDEADVTALATALGRPPADYVTESYRQLYLAHCAAAGQRATDMLFDR